ncbi:MAG: hypothetical protein WDN44_02495 [Sphingomonas sp.]
MLTAAAAPQERWVAAWATSQQVPEPRNALPPEDLRDATLRQIVRLQIGGQRFRVRLTNAFGTAPLRIDHAAIAPSLDLASPGSMPVRSRRWASTASPR